MKGKRETKRNMINRKGMKRRKVEKKRNSFREVGETEKWGKKR